MKQKKLWIAVSSLLLSAQIAAGTANKNFIQTVPVVVVQPSETVALKPGEKVNVGNYDAVNKEYIIQRLADNVYWVTGAIHRSTILIGKKGVLVIDPLAYGNGKHIIDAVHHLTSLPITHLVYTHHHVDHIGDA
jgi:glyoxylase-like metal-dependent hydrolase (beta-lactamase superfamily II)